MPDRAQDKFIAFHRLLEACGERGCPICACLVADTRRYLSTVLHEHVTDPESRARLRAAWGFCNWHAWMLRETSDAAFGTAILGEDLLRVIARRLERGPRRERSLLGRLRAMVSRVPVPDLARIYRRRPVCPACAEVAAAESHYLETALRFVGELEFQRAYEMSDGLCVPHALGALAVARGDAAGEALVRATLPKWALLRRDLAGFIGKHDHRNRAPFTESEAHASIRVVETLHGRAGLFGNDVPRGARTGRAE